MRSKGGLIVPVGDDGYVMTVTLFYGWHVAVIVYAISPFVDRAITVLGELIRC